MSSILPKSPFEINRPLVRNQTRIKFYESRDLTNSLEFPILQFQIIFTQSVPTNNIQAKLAKSQYFQTNLATMVQK